MTAKDYIKIAKIFKQHKPDWTEKDRNVWSAEYTEYVTWKGLIIDMAKMLKEDNERFHQDRFYKACGYKEYLPFMGAYEE